MITRLNIFAVTILFSALCLWYQDSQAQTETDDPCEELLQSCELFDSLCQMTGFSEYCLLERLFCEEYENSCLFADPEGPIEPELPPESAPFCTKELGEGYFDFCLQHENNPNYTKADCDACQAFCETLCADRCIRFLAGEEFQGRYMDTPYKRCEQGCRSGWIACYSDAIDDNSKLPK